MKLHFALGCLGITVGNTYRDLRVDKEDGYKLHLFVAANKGTPQHSKSWYVLTSEGWKLLRREDLWGTWRCAMNGVEAKRQPPLMEWPDEGMAQRAWELREFFQPYKMLDWYGEQLEVISFPSPEKNRITIMLRQFNEPTTLREEVLVQFLPDIEPAGGAL